MRGGKFPKDGSDWYTKIKSALDRLGAATHSFEGGCGVRFQSGDWIDNNRSTATDTTTKPISPPDWAHLRAPKSALPQKTLSPSDLEGAKFLADEEAGLDAVAAMSRGRVIHRLLEILPSVASEHWDSAAKAVIEETGAEHSVQAMLDIVKPILGNPNLVHLFDDKALSEVPFHAILRKRKFAGVIDVLVPGEQSILVVDFKSNAVIPTLPGDVPLGLLRQMGAYAAAVGAIFPDKKIDTAILWTGNGQLMPLSHGVVTEAFNLAPLP